MRYFSVVVLLIASSLSIPLMAQEKMTMGDKNWVALEKVLDDVNNQWLCAGSYHKDKAQDCVNFRAQFKPRPKWLRRNRRVRLLILIPLRERGPIRRNSS